MNRLLLLWLALGLTIGFLTCLARLSPPTWTRERRLSLPVIGTLLALAAGWTGTLLLGQYDATAVVLWVTIIGTVFIPRLLAKIVRPKRS